MPKLRSMSVKSLVKDGVQKQRDQRAIKRRMSAMEIFRDQNAPPRPPKPTAKLEPREDSPVPRKRIKEEFTLPMRGMASFRASFRLARKAVDMEGEFQSRDDVECAKSLLLSQLRMSAYRQTLSLPRSPHRAGEERVEGEPSRAVLSFSDLRIPLSWSHRDHFKNRGDPRSFAVFATVKVGDEVAATNLAYGVDRTQTDIVLPHLCLFQGVRPGFTLELTLYSVLLNGAGPGHFSASSLRHKLKGSIGRSLGGKMQTNTWARRGVVDNFEVIGRGKLTLCQADDGPRTHDLTIVAPDSPNSPPLFGHYSASLLLQPTSALSPIREGPGLSIGTSAGSLAHLYCRLLRGHLLAWRRPQDAHTLVPLLDLPINRDSVMQIGRRGHALILTLPSGRDSTAQFLLTACDQGQLREWKAALEQQIIDSKFWGAFAELNIDLSCGQWEPELPAKPTPYQTLYDQISVSDEDAQPRVKNSYSSPNIHQPPPIDSSTISSRRIGRKQKSISAFFRRSHSRTTRL